MSAAPLPASLRIHRYAGLAPGPRLIVLGAVHGNEVCGAQAIARLIDELDNGKLRIERGTLTLVPIVNPLAHALGRRQGDRNLNRNLRPVAQPQDFEDRIANVLCPLLAEHEVLLDLHSFHTAGEPFAMLGPEDNAGKIEPFTHAQAEARLVAHLGPRRVVEGWMETYARGVERRRQGGLDLAPALLDVGYGVGTTEYMRSRGGYGVTLECGQHADPAAPAVAYRAIRQTLALLGLAELPLQPPGQEFQVLKLFEVIDREDEGDVFARTWSSFDAIQSGQLIGTRKNGTPITAPVDGRIVFPNPNALPGGEWFYLARESSRAVA